MPAEKFMTEKESMELITSMINKAKNRFNENGWLYIFWGWLIFVCCAVQFIALFFFHNQNAYYIWYATWLGPFLQIFYLKKKNNQRNLKTYTDEIAAFIWMVFLVCITLLVYILIHFKIYDAICPAVLVMYGMPTFLSGIILKFTTLKIGGISCWLFAVVSVFVPYDFQLLLISFAVIIAWLIPGYLLRSKFKIAN